MVIRDPLSGFIYPEDWLLNCNEPEILDGLKKGHLILTSSGKILRRGYTTGTTAAAACKGAILSLKETLNSVNIITSSGLIVELPVECRNGTCEAVKYSGDYIADATKGIIIKATAACGNNGLILETGAGIGTNTRKTTRYNPGDPAISPKALECIQKAMEEAIGRIQEKDIRVKLSIPDGEKIAKLTLNPSLGITGGISVLGTTGFVEPWDEHLTSSILERVSELHDPVLTTGRTGLVYAHRMFPDHCVILIGKNIKDAINASNGNPVLIGLPALILKFFNPDILLGTGSLSVEELMTTPLWDIRLNETLEFAHEKYPLLSIIILDRSGNVLARRP